MHSLLTPVLLGITVLLTFAAHGQQNLSLPLGAMPMQYNGSFAGEAGSPRFNAYFGLSTGRGTFPGQYHVIASYDQFVKALSSGFGMTAYTGQFTAAPYRFNRQGFSLAVAPKISLRGKYTLSPSLDLEYNAVHLPEVPTFYIDSVLIPYGYNAKQLQSRAGLLFNTSKFYVGYSVTLVDRQAIKFTDGSRFVWRPAAFTSYFQIGYTFQRSPEAKFSFTPQLNFYIGKQVPVADFYRWAPIRVNFFQAFHLNFRYKQFIWGVNNTGVHLGWQTSRLRVMASNGISVAGRYDSGYVGNLSARYVLRSDKQ